MIAGNETIAVGRYKLVVALVLILSTIIVSVSVFSYLTWTENTSFEKQFHEDSHKILESFGSSLKRTFGLMDDLAVSMISVAKVTDQTWPLVTIPDFAARMAKLVPLTSSLSVNILPVVAPKDRMAWEEYAPTHDQWLNEAVALQDGWQEYRGPLIYNGTHSKTVYNDLGDIPYNIT